VRQAIDDAAPLGTAAVPERGHPLGRGWPRPLVASLIVLVSLIILVPAGMAIANRAAFGRFAFWAPPSRVNFCARRYYEQGQESGNPSVFRAFDSDKRAAWKQVSSTFTGRPIYAVVDPKAKPGLVCTMALYVPVGGQWIVYPLSGGP
jgi:hypothetical protein